MSRRCREMAVTYWNEQRSRPPARTPRSRTATWCVTTLARSSVALLLLSLVTSANAQVSGVSDPRGTDQPQDPKPANVDDMYLEEGDTPGQLPLNRWQVDPAPQPDLALQYRFYLDDADRIEGDAVHAYMRALLSIGQDSEADETYLDHFDAWWADPTNPENRETMAKWVQRYSSLFPEISHASRCRDCNWDFSYRDEESVSAAFSMLLPEVQLMRKLARILQVKALLQIADEDYPAACETLRQLYQLGFDTAKTPLLVADLVGAAIVGMANATVEKLIAAPGSPNLYWALATLPDPLIDLRPAIHHELSIVLSGFEFLRDPENVSRSPEEWKRIMGRDFAELMSFNGSANPDNSLQMQLMAAGFAMKGFPLAKRELMKAGYQEEVLDKMPVAQVVAIHQSRLYKRIFNEIYKISYLPTMQQLHGHEMVDNLLQELGMGNPIGSENLEVFPFATLLLPAVGNVYPVPPRLARHVAALKTVELIRMEMAANGGTFPNSLDEFRQVPVPADPATGVAFPYRMTDNRPQIIVRSPEKLPTVGYGFVIELERRGEAVGAK